MQVKLTEIYCRKHGDYHPLNIWAAKGYTEAQVKAIKENGDKEGSNDKKWDPELKDWVYRKSVLSTGELDRDQTINRHKRVPTSHVSSRAAPPAAAEGLRRRRQKRGDSSCEEEPPKGDQHRGKTPRALLRRDSAASKASKASGVKPGTGHRRRLGKKDSAESADYGVSGNSPASKAIRAAGRKAALLAKQKFDKKQQLAQKREERKASEKDKKEQSKRCVDANKVLQIVTVPLMQMEDIARDKLDNSNSFIPSYMIEQVKDRLKELRDAAATCKAVVKSRGKDEFKLKIEDAYKVKRTAHNTIEGLKLAGISV